MTGPVDRRAVAPGIAAMLVAAIVVAPFAHAESRLRGAGTVSLFFENDLFAGTDESYTNGVKLAWTSPDLSEYRDSDKLPEWAWPWVDRLPFINEPGLQRSLVLAIGQNMFTPSDTARRDLIVDDRPYAGWLYGSAAFLNKNPRRLDVMEVQVGIVGPLSFAEQSQALVHDLRGLSKPNGWDHQLETEPGLNLYYERRWRAYRRHVTTGLGFDVVAHLGGALGNVATHANAGLELRLGWNVPADFGTTLIRAGGDTNAPVSVADPRRRGGLGAHLFAIVDARAVGRDIFLDGNTFADSHSVDKRSLVADVAIGASVLIERMKISFARVWRSREFHGQAADHGFGSITVSYTF